MKKEVLKDRVLVCLLGSGVFDNLTSLAEDYPFSSEDFDCLTVDELKKIWLWTSTMMYEASDNPVKARYAPRCLRQILPKDHYLQKWRMPKQRKVTP